jgi:ribose transport system substrate-binding protein
MRKYHRPARQRFAMVASIGLAALFAAACSTGSSGGSSTAATAGGTGSSGHHWTIVAAQADVADPYFLTMECGAKHQATLSDVNLKWMGSTSTDVPTEISTLQAAALTKPDAIFETPFDPTAFLAPVRQVMQQGIPYLMVDGALGKPVAWKYLVTANSNLTHIVGDPIASAMGHKGTIGILSSTPDNTIENIRFQGWVKLFGTADPNIKVLSPQYTNTSEATAATDTSAMIQANPGLTAIFATNGPELDGAVSAVKAAGKAGKIKLFGYSPVLAQDISNIKQGIVYGVWAQSPYYEGVDAIKMLTAYLDAHGAHSGPVPADTKPYEYNTPLKFITKANVNAASTKPFYGLTSADGPTC